MEASAERMGSVGEGVELLYWRAVARTLWDPPTIDADGRGFVNVWSDGFENSCNGEGGRK